MSTPLVLTDAIVLPGPLPTLGQETVPVIDLTGALGGVRKSALVFQPVEALLPGLADPLPVCA
ncbi:MAG: hypothetical protein MUE98_03075 [Rhodobacteraceae bacterium]|nr:hypothetical protein [Paracoccaceae bacterium]